MIEWLRKTAARERDRFDNADFDSEERARLRARLKALQDKAEEMEEADAMRRARAIRHERDVRSRR